MTPIDADAALEPSTSVASRAAQVVEKRA